jgi:hypothetical protein
MKKPAPSADLIKQLRAVREWCEEVATKLERGTDSPVDRAIYEHHGNHVVLAWLQRGVVTFKAMSAALTKMADEVTDPTLKAEILARGEHYKDLSKSSGGSTWTPIQAVLGAVHQGTRVFWRPIDTAETWKARAAEQTMRHLRTGVISTTDVDAINVKELSAACLALINRKPTSAYRHLVKALAKTSFHPSYAVIKTEFSKRRKALKHDD